MVYDERWQAVIITWSICRTIPLVIMVRCSRRHNTSCWYHRDTSWLPHSKSPMMVLHEKCSYSWQFRGISHTFLAKISSIWSQNSPVCREHRQFKLWAETWTPWNLKNPWISISWLPTIYMPSQPRTLSWWHWWLRISQSRPDRWSLEGFRRIQSKSTVQSSQSLHQIFSFKGSDLFEVVSLKVSDVMRYFIKTKKLAKTRQNDARIMHILKSLGSKEVPS